MGVLRAVALVLLGASTAAAQQYMWEPPGASDFPASDANLRSYHLMAVRATAADEAARKEPDRARTFDLLLKTGRIAEALDVLDRIVRSRPDEMPLAFSAVGWTSLEINNPAHNYAARLREAAAIATQKLPSLPRDEAAKLAHALIGVEGQLDRQARIWRPRTEQLVAEYAGTRTALLAEVDLLTDRIGPAMLAPLDAFVAAHPGTEEAAKALYQKGFHLGVNAFSFGWKVGDDPTERFEQVLQIYRELRSGRYPPCEWVDKAPGLVTGFSAYKATYKPGNLDRVLAVYEELAPEFLAAYERDPKHEAIKSLFGSRMTDLFKLKGNPPVAAIEEVFSRLERRAKNPFTVRMLRAEWYLRPDGVDANDWKVLRPKAVPLLEEAMAGGTALVRRRAHATLAVLHFADNHLEQARTLYQRFAATYPQSEYAWVATIRAAQAIEPSDPSRAAAELRAAATRYRTNAIAGVLAHAYAARAWESAGEFAEALADYRETLRVWDPHHNTRLSLDPRGGPEPGDPVATRQRLELVREELPERIATLERTLAVPGGVLLERARRANGLQQWDSAATASSELLSKHPSSPLVPEARYLASRARLEKALDRADAEKADASVPEAIAQLEAIIREPTNAAVAAAKIALGTIGHLATTRQDGEALVTEALRDWQALDRAQPAASGDALERDIREIRDVVFQPHGGGIFANNKQRGHLEWRSSSGPYYLVNPIVRVKTSGGIITRLPIYGPLASYDTVVFLDDERRGMLERIMLKLGGTKKKAWVRVMDIPNQPAGDSLQVLALWRKAFWAEGGHWGGWVFDTYPSIHEIEFIDAARTRAAVKVTVGYTGCTVQMQKKNGVWQATGLTDFWIT